MNLKELWIGDQLRIKGTTITGTFEGSESNNIAIVKINHELKKFNDDQLELVENNEDFVPDISDITNPEIKSRNKIRLDHSIDLHIESLNPSIANLGPERILTFQLKAIEEFVSSHKVLGSDYLIIIHGKGEGVLRQHVHELLNLKYKVKIYRLTNNEGATEVWL
ncbi:MAG: Smr/MutS family protein [Saprospiraceae bacterium]|nr:Smr/MutS family protein [Saprospiraceae bacterium]